MLATNDPLAVDVVTAIRTGDTDRLGDLLRAHPDLAREYIGTASDARSLLHIVTDWPGHFPSGAATVALLAAAGADLNAGSVGKHAETPLHWAASSDDIAVLDALLDAGADIDATGAVNAGGTALEDARIFGQWNAGRRLIERGASTTIEDAAAFGLLDRLGELAATASDEDLDRAFWYAGHGGQRIVAEYLLERGVNVNWRSPWGDDTALDTAEDNGFTEYAAWLRTVGGCRAAEC